MEQACRLCACMKRKPRESAYGNGVEYLETIGTVTSKIAIKKEKICDRNAADETFRRSIKILKTKNRECRNRKKVGSIWTAGAKVVWRKAHIVSFKIWKYVADTKGLTEDNR